MKKKMCRETENKQHNSDRPCITPLVLSRPDFMQVVKVIQYILMPLGHYDNRGNDICGQMILFVHLFKEPAVIIVSDPFHGLKIKSSIFICTSSNDLNEKITIQK